MTKFLNSDRTGNDVTAVFGHDLVYFYHKCCNNTLIKKNDKRLVFDTNVNKPTIQIKFF